ncbi:MAG: FHA domain-containing protein [Bifidobacteriaceae bacterium]|jgi:hypothetical protein|nr:FHA domain-containing protein [Bifidobacteriaceae bacterium]
MVRRSKKAAETAISPAASAFASEVPAARVMVTPIPLPIPLTGLGKSARPASAPSDARPVIELSTGERIVVTGSGIVGRQPDVAATDVHVVRVDDAQGTVSRNHFAFGLTTGGLVWVQDMGSRNGTYVVAPEGSYPLVSGKKLTVGDGARLMFGSHSAVVRWGA